MASIIGIDIGSRFVKVVQIEPRGKFKLLNTLLFPTPYRKDAPSKIDSDEFFNTLISKVPYSVLKTSSIGINIPSSSVIVIVVELPKMSHKELRIAAIAEARRKMVPTPGPDSVFQYVVLGEVVTAGVPRFEVLVIKTNNSSVEDIFSSFDSFGGVHPSFISPTCYTILNAFTKKTDVFDKEVGFVDLGVDSIDVSIMRKGKLRFYRNIKFGIKNALTHVSSSLNISLDEAISVVREKGVPQVEVDLNDKVRVAEEIMRQKYEASTHDGGQEEINALELRMLLDTEINRIIQEIRRTFIYYSDQTKGGRVDNLFFVGGGATIKGLVPILANEIGGNCQLGDPFVNMEIALSSEDASLAKDVAPMFSQAVSIALSIPSVKKRDLVIDFLPDDIKKQEQVLHRQVAAIAIVFGLFAIAFLGWLKVSIDNKLLIKNIERLDFKMKRADKFLNMLQEVNQQKGLAKEHLGKIKEILERRIDMFVILKEIANLTPEDVTLSELYIGKKKPEVVNEDVFSDSGQEGKENQEIIDYIVTLNAFCRADYEKAVEIAKEFCFRLEDSGYFQKVVLTPPRLEKIVPNVGEETMVLTVEGLRKFAIDAALLAGEQ